MVNKTDPLAGSDISHRSNPTSNLTPADAGYGTSTTVSQDAGYGASSTNVSHGTDYATTSSATPGSGAAHGTAGPHDSNIANRLDPRLESFPFSMCLLTIQAVWIRTWMAPTPTAVTRPPGKNLGQSAVGLGCTVLCVPSVLGLTVSVPVLPSIPILVV